MLQKLDDAKKIIRARNGDGVCQVKTFLSEVKQGITPGSLWRYEDVGHTHEANDELAKLIGKGIFDNPKPTKLIKRIIHLATDSKNEDIVLDFFAGSGTTAHAVIQKNIEDDGNRSFISVQDPQLIRRGKYKTISEILRDRIKIVFSKLDNENIDPIVTGFRYYKLK